MTKKAVELLIPDRSKGCCVELAEPIPARDADDHAAVFKALGDRTRVQIVHMLKAAKEPACVCDFTAAFDIGQATVSHHLAKLRDAGLVTSSKSGIWVFYELRKDLSPAAKQAVASIP